MRVGFDVTALLRARTGVGVFTHTVLGGLCSRDDVDLAAYATTWRGRREAGAVVPPGAHLTRRPMAAQPLRRAWMRFDHPVIERWIGPVDVVHGPNFVVPPTRRAAEVVTVHDLTCVRFAELCTADVLQYPSLIRRAVDRGAWVHALSRFVADEVIEHFGVAAERVVVVHGAPSLPSDGPGTDAAAGRALAASHRYVLALGTVEPRKDTPALVRAFDAIADDHPDVALVVAGPDGWGVDAFTAAVATARHRSRILRLGWVDDASRAALLRGATVFAYPSRYEGFGLPPLEAMAAGLPVLATAAGALPEVIGDAGLLVAPGDADALADGLGRLLSDDHQRASLIEAGLANVSRFSWDRTVTELVQLYRTAAAAGQRSARRVRL